MLDTNFFHSNIYGHYFTTFMQNLYKKTSKFDLQVKRKPTEGEEFTNNDREEDFTDITMKLLHWPRYFIKRL